MKSKALMHCPKCGNPCTMEEIMDVDYKIMLDPVSKSCFSCLWYLLNHATPTNNGNFCLAKSHPQKSYVDGFKIKSQCKKWEDKKITGNLNITENEDNILDKMFSNHEEFFSTLTLLKEKYDKKY
ncbi:MAG: hypothetical protein Q7J06_11725 [Bacteroidales bacterium]|nr:hypothetical protein [Bacteroidales bacterium]